MSTIAFTATMLNLRRTATETSLQSILIMAAIESPCVNVCTVDQVSALCVGCGRNLAEIAAWSRYSVEERRRVMAELPQRLSRLPAPIIATADTK
jgi:predicted Fe-S protein YdhL (DUF1289 family)